MPYVSGGELAAGASLHFAELYGVGAAPPPWAAGAAPESAPVSLGGAPAGCAARRAPPARLPAGAGAALLLERCSSGASGEDGGGECRAGGPRPSGLDAVAGAPGGAAGMGGGAEGPMLTYNPFYEVG